jgi:CxxC motif-containing protein (DUF1111 family)
VSRLALVALALAVCGCGAAPDGAALFQHRFTRADGLGPRFNRASCAACHSDPAPGGAGRGGLATALRAGRLGGGNAPAPAHSSDPDCPAGIPAGADVTSVRNAPALFGAGRIDAIPAGAIRAGAAVEPAAVRGRLGSGRFGWKADVPTLRAFVLRALHDELGVTTRRGSACAGPAGELDDRAARALTSYIAGLDDPRPPRRALPGAAVFARTGCGACHSPQLAGVPLYSDLLVHDMGPALDDRMRQGAADGREWRTAPLWGLGDRSRFLHDGRATSIEGAIRLHGGQAAAAARRFRELTGRDRRRLLAFLRSARSGG